MEIYRTEPRFDQKTGKLTDPEIIYEKTICDYTGRELLRYTPDAVSYECHDISGSEEWWYYEEFFIENKRVNISEFVANAPRFIYERSVVYDAMILEYSSMQWNNFITKKSIKAIQNQLIELKLKPIALKEVPDFRYMMLHCKFRVIQKLISEGYTPEQLNLTFDEDA